ncbi:ATP-binding protein [Candidatus Cyanaurora vandensis]|uniref:hybrid sensor histidine kinase/response regulator n=1 Tax=Candidatus Cyanaurora vandensis TaxID=2714958 RepID=UPI00257AE340|nr:ATP-binding protein [Candidatus Cyanaurora vandensis]
MQFHRRLSKKQLIDGLTTLCERVTELEQAVEDQTQLLALEQQARKEAEISSQLKDEFLATVAHELRTPLNVILGWTQMLRRKITDPAAAQRALEIIERNVVTQNRLIEDLLDVARMVPGKIRLDMQSVVLAEIVQTAIDSVIVIALSKGVQLTVNLDGDTSTVLGDPNRLQQVIWNLLINAIKFTPAGGNVVVQMVRVAGQIVVTVSDTGQGITPELLPHIFERFRQEAGPTTRYQAGLGLGLTITRHLVALHGGTLEAASAGAGQGATFTLRLGVSAIRGQGLIPVLLGIPVEREASYQAHYAGGLNQLKVLVVDDDLEARNLTSIALRQAQVRSASSAKVALAMLTEWGPHILVSDITMPDEDGYVFIQKVRALDAQQGNAIPAIALTARNQAEDRQYTIQAGYQAYIVKPVQMEELIHLILELTKGSDTTQISF